MCSSFGRTALVHSLRGIAITVALVASISGATAGDIMQTLSGKAADGNFSTLQRMAANCGADETCCGTRTRPGWCECYRCRIGNCACATR